MSAKLAAAAATRTSTWPVAGLGVGDVGQGQDLVGLTEPWTVHARTGRPSSVIVA